MAIECDVLVVGAGVAGSVAALSCSKNGLNTVLVEKNSKVGAVTKTKIDSSTDIGLTKIIKELKLETKNFVRKSKWHAPSGNFFLLNSKIGEYYFKRGAEKDSFECSTVEKAIAKGCNLLLKSKPLKIGNKEVLIGKEGKKIIVKPEIIIAADGCNSFFHKYVKIRPEGEFLGFGVTGKNFCSKDTSEIYFNAELIPGGYFYIVTCKDGTSSAAIVIDGLKGKNVSNYFKNYFSL